MKEDFLKFIDNLLKCYGKESVIEFLENVLTILKEEDI